MTPEQAIKRHILVTVELRDFNELNENNIDEVYDFDLENSEIADLYEAVNEFRYGDEETSIYCDSSRHYESKPVASKLVDGTWVGWTYWYGGGKHGEPDAMDWIEDAYYLSVKEEQKVVTIRTFKKVKNNE